MRIGILGYVGTHRTGIGRYIDELVTGWQDRCERDGHTVDLYVNDDSPLDVASAQWIRRRRISAPAGSALGNLLWVLRHSGRVYRSAALDVLWLPNFTWPPTVPMPIVATVHDLIEFRVPGKFDAFRMLYRRRAVPRMVSRSTHIVTVSDTTKRDIVAEFGVRPDKVTVVPNGVSSAFRPTRRDGFSELAVRWSLRQPYVLYVGTLDHPGKNVATLLRAFSAARSQLPAGTQLVLAGKPGKGYDQLLSIATQLGLGPGAADAHWLGFVPDSALPALYASAAVFVFPSLYEGFGLPLLEAMASGVPTVASDTGALRELGANASILVPPLDVASVAHGVVSLCNDQVVASDVAQRGLRRAQSFTWERAACATLDVLLEHAAHATR